MSSFGVHVRVFSQETWKYKFQLPLDNYTFTIPCVPSGSQYDKAYNDIISSSGSI